MQGRFRLPCWHCWLSTAPDDAFPTVELGVDLFPQCCLNRHGHAALSFSTKPLLFAGLFLQNISVLLCFLSVSPFSCVFLFVSLVDICFLSIPL